MESPNGQETYSFYLSDAVKGPLTRTEAEALIKSGEVTQDTPCAPVGASDWKPASEFFAFTTSTPAPAASSPALKRSSNHQEKEEKTRPELDPLLRKKILRLGLATATTIDEFSESQALAAVNAYEDNLRKTRKAKWLGGVGTGVGVLAAVVLFGFSPPGEALNETLAGKIIGDSETYSKTKSDIVGELSVVNNSRVELQKKQLKEPEGEKAGEKFLTERVRVPNSRQNQLVFKVDVTKGAALSKTPPRALYLKSLPDSISKQMLAQTEIAWKYKNPDKLTDKLEEAELAASWALFRSETGTAIPEFVKLNTTSQIELTNTSVDEKRILQGSTATYIVVALDIKIKDDEASPFTIYFPYRKQEIVPFSDAEQHKTSKEEMLEIEHYVVKEKKQLGGVPYGIPVSFQGKKFFLEKKSPPLFFIGVLQEDFQEGATTWVRLKSEDEYNKAEIGARIPTKQLLPNLCYSKPAEYRMVSPLVLKDKNN